MPLNLFYTMVQKKSKMTENSNQGGSCLNRLLLIQPTTNAKGSLNRRNNNSSNDTGRCWKYTILLMVLDKSGGKGSSRTSRRFGVQYHRQSVAMKGKFVYHDVMHTSPIQHSEKL